MIVVTTILIAMFDLLRQEIKQSKPFDDTAEEAFLNLQRTTDFLMRKVCGALKPFDITPPQFNVLRILRGAGTEGLIHREIGERMLTFVPDVTRMLDRLEEKKLICRERGSEDRRLVKVFITEDGLNLLSQTDETLCDFHKNLLGGCDEKELKKLIGLLEKLRFNLIAKS